MSTEARFEDEFLKFLQCLAEADCLKNIIIAGSWAEFLYEQCHVINPPYYADMKTYDTDFFVVTGERPNADKSLHEIAKENGFEPVHDYETGIVKYIGRDNFEVEFLSEQIGSPEETQLFPMTSIGVRGTQLPHMWPMRMFNQPVVYNGYMVKIPTPEAYAVHKMIINPDRGEKAINDQEKVKNIFPYLDREDMKKICEHLSQRENKIVNSFMARFLSISSLDYYLYPEKYPALSEAIKNQIIAKIDDIIYLDRQTQQLKEQLDAQAVKEMRRHRKKAVKEIKNLLDGQKVSADSLVAILGDMGNRANIKRVVVLIKEYEKSHSREQKHE